MRRLACLCVLGLVWVGCGSGGDKKAPPSPRIEPVDSPTNLEHVTIHGTAEPGATIEMSGAKSFDPAEITADPYTAEFHVIATLEPDTESTLRFVAKDRAGNESEPATLKIVQETGHGVPSMLTLDLFIDGADQPAKDPIMLAAGAKVHAVSEVRDAAGHVLDLPVAISTSIPGAFVAGADVSNIRASGQYEIAASVPGSSLAFSREIEVTPGAATQITLDVSPAIVTAGTTVYVTAIAHDAFGNVVPDTAIDLTSVPALPASHTAPCSTKKLDQGFVEAGRFVAYDLSDVAGSGYVFTIKATSGDVSATAPVTVHPGAAARFAPLDAKDCKKGDAFAFTDATWKKDLDEPVSVAAGSTVYYRYTVIDAYGNDTTGPVSVVTTAPGATIIDDGTSGVGQVAHVTSAGTFDLSAYVAGVSAPEVKSFSVDVAPAHTASMFLSSSLVSPGDTVYAFATIRDAFGNVVPCPDGAIDASTIEVTATPAATATAGDTTCSDGVFQRSFSFSGNGTYSVTATYKVGGSVSTSSFVTVLGIDATPPTVSIENLLVDGVTCTFAGDPLACPVARNSLIEFDLVADDNISLSELEYSALFQTTGTQPSLATRSVLISGNTQLPTSAHFSFRVSQNALQQDVALVGLAIDGAGNRMTSDELLLRVGVYATFGRTVEVIASGGTLNGPTDVAFNAAGDMFIANDGDQNLLEIASGSSSPVVFSSFNRNARYIAVDGGGNIYLTDSNRISKVNAAGSSVVNYLQIAGQSAQGLAIAGATRAKGTVSAAASSDGATVSIAGQSFELDSSGNGCGAGVCVATGGASANQALATAIQSNSAMVDATYDAGTNKVVLAAKSAGESGNSITLTASGMSVSAGGTLSQGHAEELFLGQTNDNNIYRLPEDLTPTASTASNHGAFDVGTTQRGIAVKDMSSALLSNLRELYFYFIDSQNNDRLRAYHAVDASTPAQVFSLQGGAGQSFQSLYDVVLQPTLPAPAANPVNGCLLVSDDPGNNDGRIFAIDTRVATDTMPTVTLVASGFNEPRGMAFYNGNLYVVDRGDDAIVKLGPSPSASDCF